MTRRPDDDSSYPVRRGPEPLAWEKRKGESAAAFHNFAVYRDLGPHRSLSKAAAGLGKSIDTLKEQSAKNGWVERAEAYDDDLDRRLREDRETERMRLERAQLGLGSQMVSIVLRRLAGSTGGVDSEGNPVEPVEALSPNDLDASDVARIAIAGVRIQRQAAGLPTDILRGVTSIEATDFIKVVKDVVEILMPLIPEERHVRANSELDTYFATGRRW